jgi:hypothetical protein
MARNVVVDLSNVLTEINKGNESVAKTLAKMRAGGVTLYYDQQGFREAVTNNPQALEGTANAQTSREFGIVLAPQDKAQGWYEFYALNSANGKDAVVQDGGYVQTES